MKTTHIIVALAGITLALFTSPAYSQGVGFTIPFVVTDNGSHTDTLYFGRNSLATNCIDTVIGEHELQPPVSGILDARFVNAGGSGGCLGNGVKVSLYPKFSFAYDTFHIALQPATGQTLFHLSWPSNLQYYFFGARLVDQFGGFLVNVNMDVDTMVEVHASLQRLDIITSNVIDLAVRESKLLPADFELSQNYPNPFNPITIVRYAVLQTSLIEVAVHDLLGRKTAVIVFEELTPGYYHSQWNGRDANGAPASSGVYLLRMTARSSGNRMHGGPQLFSSVRKMVLLK